MVCINQHEYSSRDGRQEFLSRVTCSLHTLSRIISFVTAISTRVCITRLTGNLWVPTFSPCYLSVHVVDREVFFSLMHKITEMIRYSKNDFDEW